MPPGSNFKGHRAVQRPHRLHSNAMPHPGPPSALQASAIPLGSPCFWRKGHSSRHNPHSTHPSASSEIGFCKAFPHPATTCKSGSHLMPFALRALPHEKFYENQRPKLNWNFLSEQELASSKSVVRAPGRPKTFSICQKYGNYLFDGAPVLSVLYASLPVKRPGQGLPWIPHGGCSLRACAGHCQGS